MGIGFGVWSLGFRVKCLVFSVEGLKSTANIRSDTLFLMKEACVNQALVRLFWSWEWQVNKCLSDPIA